ncbi:hypothetical protein HED55_10030 [Ochrobactrum haematophilum]|uniref:Uncharacterized protein n=1 Tax=Brucella haematophila TaxID=419474 RepID=A0ABX1DM61_9HYPH|nr:hypothetical protein [Brucella haematophila]
MAYITIYACCDDKASFESLSLGFISTIPGKMESQSKIYINASGFKDTFSINISSKQSLEYDIDSLSIKAQRVVHNNNEGRDGDIALGSYDVGAVIDSLTTQSGSVQLLRAAIALGSTRHWLTEGHRILQTRQNWVKGPIMRLETVVLALME